MVDISTGILTIVIEKITQFPDQRIVSFCGYPCCGKTTLARNISTSDHFVTLPMENFIESRKNRIKQQISGCDPKAYSLEKLNQIVAELLNGKSVSVFQYSWSKGSIENAKKTISLKKDQYLIIDGSTSHMIKNKFPNETQVVYFYPRNEKKWLKCSIIRDIKLRGYSEEVSRKNNQQKLIDLKLLFSKSKITANSTIELNHILDGDTFKLLQNVK